MNLPLRFPTTLSPLKRVLVRPIDWAVERLEQFPATPKGSKTKARLTCVFLQWDPRGASGELDALAARLRSFPELDATIVLVDNRAAEVTTVRDANATFVVPGDNRAWEFSGLQSGIDAANERGVVTDVWLLANDRYRADGHPFIPCLSGQTVRAAIELQGIVGHVDAYPKKVASYGYAIHRWVTTSFLLLHDDVLRRCAPLVTLDSDQVDGILQTDGDAVVSTSGPIGRDHGAYLTAWLTGRPGTDLRTRWYGTVDRDRLDPAVLRRKVQSILNEQLLSARAIQMGIPLVPIETAHLLGQAGLDHPTVRRTVTDMLAHPNRHPLLSRSRIARVRLALSVRSSYAKRHQTSSRRRDIADINDLESDSS